MSTGAVCRGRAVCLVAARVLVALVAAAASAVVTSGAQAAPVFMHLGAEDGLPAQVVWDIAQDGQGYIWLATSAGLARYDGIALIVHRNDPEDPRSLPSDGINDLFVDRAGTLWVATNGGLCRYDAGAEAFERFPIEPESPRSLPAVPVFAVAEASDGGLWIAAGDDGLFDLDPSTGDAIRYRHDATDPSTLVAGFVGTVYVDRGGRLWVGTLGGGLDRLAAGGSLFEHIPIGPLEGQRNPLHDNVRAIREDRRGDVWVGSDDGLNRLSAATGERTFYGHDYERPDNPRALGNNYANSILEDSTGRIWIGTWDGVNRYDPKTDGFERDPRTSTPRVAGAVGIVTSMMEDRSGVVWFAGRGVDRFDPVSEKIASLTPAAADPAAPIVAALGEVPVPKPGLFVDADGLVWAGSMRGLTVLDPATGRWSAHLRVPDFPSYPDNSVYALHEGIDGFIHVGIPQSIALFLRRRGFGPTLITLRGTPSALHQDRSRALWAGMPGLGIARLPGRGGEDQEYFPFTMDGSAGLTGAFVFFMREDAAGRFWIGTDTGLHLMDRETATFRRFGVVDSAVRLSHPEARALAEAADGSLWIGTGHGLSVLDADTLAARHVSASDGLAHDSVHALAFDRAGALWIGTEGGLSRLTPATGQIRSFRWQQGLPDNEIMSLAVAPNGDLYAATRAALVRVRPAELEGAAAEPPVVVRVTIPTSAPAGAGGATAFTSRASDTALRLTHRDTVVSFDLAVLDYRDPQRNRYAYRLEGVDPGWVYTEGEQRRATYTTLPAGRYRFSYRGADSTGQWTTDTRVLDVTVLPAPWRSGLAYALYAAAALLTAAGAIVLRTRAATVRARALEVIVRERTHELSLQRDTIERQSERLAEAASAKDRLYTNVSHEFRTPITVILGALERLLQLEQASNGRPHMDTIRRNAQRLLRLVEQLMQLARLDAARAAGPSPQPVGQRVRLLVESFRTLAEDKGIALDVQCEAVWARCDEDALETIVVNLVSNAIKYTPPPGSVTVLARRADPGFVHIVVSDSGIGIPKDQQANVFERFYRASDAVELAPGSGLGLALVKELVAVNGGDLSLVSEPGVGTSVSVRLPEGVGAEAEAGLPEPSPRVVIELAALDPPPPLAGAPVDDGGSAANGAVPRVLIIEDNQDLCRHVAEVLGTQFRSEFATDGASGVERAVEAVPDVILCDVMLPKLDGFEVVRRLKEDERTDHIPIIMLTARADEESRLAGLGALADDYVTKPFSAPELRQRVDRLLAVREILRQRYGSHAGNVEDLKAELGARDRRFVERLEHVLERHHSDAELTLPGLASLLAMSERQLQRKLKALLNTTPREYVRDYRLRRARRMIEDGERISTVAFAVGFTSQSYFTSCFRARYGLTPSEARARRES